MTGFFIFSCKYYLPQNKLFCYHYNYNLRMRKALSFLVACFVCIGAAGAVSRATNTNPRGAVVSSSRGVTSRSTTTTNTASRTANVSPRKTTARTTATTSRSTVSRAATNTSTAQTTAQRQTTSTRTTQTTSRAANTTRATTKSLQISRAAVPAKTFGVGYNSCRDAYFTCMDQFCATANDEYRRCICSSRLYEIKKKQHDGR